MLNEFPLHGPGGLTRRGVVCIGAAAGIAALSTSRLRAIEPIAIALPDFFAGAPGVAELASLIPEIITRQPQAQRAVRADRSGRVHRENHEL
jgi:hypothetical protein